VSAYLVAVWMLYFADKYPRALRNCGVPIAVVLILASSATSEPVLATGVVLAVLVAVDIAARSRAAGNDRLRADSVRTDE
jgi:hypothetical protein